MKLNQALHRPRGSDLQQPLATLVNHVRCSSADNVPQGGRIASTAASDHLETAPAARLTRSSALDPLAANAAGSTIASRVAQRGRASPSNTVATDKDFKVDGLKGDGQLRQRISTKERHGDSKRHSAMPAREPIIHDAERQPLLNDEIASSHHGPLRPTHRQLPLWVLLALGSGTFAALNGGFAKLTTADSTSAALAALLARFHLPADSPLPTILDVVVRATCFGLNVAANAVMWALFTRALTAHSSATQVSVVNTAANFLVTAVLGVVLFRERVQGLWWLGAGLLVIGSAIVGRSRPADEHNLPPPSNSSSSSLSTVHDGRTTPPPPPYSDWPDEDACSYGANTQFQAGTNARLSPDKHNLSRQNTADKSKHANARTRHSHFPVADLDELESESENADEDEDEDEEPDFLIPKARHEGHAGSLR